MHRLWISMVVAWMATNMWATLGYQFEKMDRIAGQEAFATNMKLDPETNILSFTDNYQRGKLFDRQYIIDFYEWIESGAHETSIYKVTYNGDASYVYGYPVRNSGNEIYTIGITDIRTSNNKRIEKTVDAINSTGGPVSIDISKEIETILEVGKTKIHFVVGIYRNENGDYLSAETDKGYSQGRDLNCCVNGYTARFSYNDLYYRDPVDPGKPELVQYGDSVRFSLYAKGMGQTTYRLQESWDLSTWNTVATGTIGGKKVREGTLISVGWKFDQDGMPGESWGRVVLEDNNSHVRDTSNSLRIIYAYEWNDEQGTRYHPSGQQFNYQQPAECERYTLTSNLPVKQSKSGSYIRYTQPACNVTLKKSEPLYAVRFYNADNTILSVCMTRCGQDAVAPPTPSYKGYEFTGWSRTFTNVHNDLNVYARYDIGDNYTFNTAFRGHKNELHPMEGFAGNDKRATIGDSLTFEASICAKFEMNLKYQIADTKDSQGNWLWSDAFSAGTFTAQEAASNWAQAKTFRVTRAVGYDYWQEKMNVPGYAFRFVVYCQGTAIYSEPWEFEVYYPITVKSQIDAWYDASLTEQLTVFNNSGDQLSGTSVTIPARVNDTIWVSMEKGDGACMQFARTNRPNPAYAVAHGEDALDRTFFICPNETETVNVTVKNYAVVFENAEPRHNYDFSAQGLGKWNNKYYAEVVRCGGAVKKMPAEPERAEELFVGWINNTTGVYADDDYKHVPALPVGDNYLIFEAKWEPVPVLDTYLTVTYFDEDGTTELSTEKVLYNTAAVGFTPFKGDKVFIHWLDKQTDQRANLQYVRTDMQVYAVFGDNSGIEEVLFPGKQQKILRNGQLLIRRNERIYNAEGKQIQ